MSAHPGRSRDPCRDADGIESREFAPLLPLPRRASWSVSTRAVGASTMAAQLLRLDSIDRWLDRERQDALAGSNDENSAPLTPSHTLGRVAGKQRSFEVTTPASTSTPARGRPSALSRADSVASCETDATEIVAEPACADAIEDVAPVVVELSRRKPCVPLLALFADRSGPLRYTSLQPLCSRWPSARFLAICLHPALGSSCPSPRSSSPPSSRPPDRSLAHMPCTSSTSLLALVHCPTDDLHSRTILFLIPRLVARAVRRARPAPGHERAGLPLELGSGSGERRDLRRQRALRHERRTTPSSHALTSYF